MSKFKFSDAVSMRMVQIFQEAIMTGVDGADLLRQVELEPSEADPSVLVMTPAYVQLVKESHAKLERQAEELQRLQHSQVLFGKFHLNLGPGDLRVDQIHPRHSVTILFGKSTLAHLPRIVHLKRLQLKLFRGAPGVEPVEYRDVEMHEAGIAAILVEIEASGIDAPLEYKVGLGKAIGLSAALIGEESEPLRVV